MNRHDWYYKQQVTQSEMDELETYTEDAMRDMARDLYGTGIVAGWTVQQHAPANLSVDVTPGKGWDFSGLRVATSATQVVDCSKDKNGASTTVTASGREKWLSILAYFVRVPSDPRVDGSGGTVYFRQLEGCVFRVVQGAESAAPAVRPAKPSDGGLLLADVKLSYGTAAITSAMIDTSRRDSLVPHTASDIQVVDEGSRFAGADVEAVLAEIDAAADAHTALTTAAHGGLAPSSHVGAAGSAHGIATASVAGFMSAADKSKLDGVAAGAQPNQNAFGRVKAGATTINAATPVDTVEIVAGTGIAVSGNTMSKTVTISASSGQAPAAHNATHASGGADAVTPASIGAETPAGAQAKVDSHANRKDNPHAVTVAQIGAAPSSHVGATGDAHGVATASMAGFMSAADKSKLNGIEAGATADMTSSGILTALKTVDGAGSGLDADLLQGVSLAAIPRRQLYVGDETEKSVKGTTATTVKSHKVVQCSSHGLKVTKILVIAELKRDTSGTGYLDVYVDGSLAFTLSTASASYALVKGSKDLSFSDDTIHTVDIKLRHSSSSYSAYNRLYECYVEVS